MHFTLKAYESLLNKIKENKYSCIFYNEMGTKSKEIIIGHDVDFSLENALEMAILENHLKVKSTYFVLITSPFYNINEKNARLSLKKIQELGHKIGLHFDHTVYNSNEITDIIKFAVKEVHQLALATESNVNVISFHRPAKFILDANIHFPHDIINTYSNEFFNQIKYISDSRMCWKENPYEVLKNDIRKIQLLVHPIWYYSDEKKPNAILKNFFVNKTNKIYNDMDLNFTNLKEFFVPINIFMEEENDKL